MATSSAHPLRQLEGRVHGAALPGHACRSGRSRSRDCACPKIYNLRTDPYEFADITSNSYYDWFIYHAYILYAAQIAAAKFAATFKDFPPMPEARQLHHRRRAGKMRKRPAADSRRSEPAPHRSARGDADAERIGASRHGRASPDRRHMATLGLSADGTAALVERRRRRSGHPRLRRARDAEGGAGLRARQPSASPSSTTTARCGRAADVLPGRSSPSTASRRSRPQHPEWKTQRAVQALLDGRHEGAAGQRRERASPSSSMATHAGMTTDEFEQIVKRLAGDGEAPEARAGRTPRCVYQPMLELLGVPARERLQDLHRLGRRRRVHARLRRRRSTAFRPSRWSAATIKTQFEMRDGKPVLMRDCRRSTSSTTRPASRSASTRFIGRRPILAFGNSDGDREMLKWTTLGRADGRPPSALIVHHTDAERECAYDRSTSLDRPARQGRWTRRRARLGGRRT